MFEDGTAIGSNAVINNVLAQREAIYKALDQIEPTLRQVADGKVDRTSFKKMTNAYLSSVDLDATIPSYQKEGSHTAANLVFNELTNNESRGSSQKTIADAVLEEIQIIKAKIANAKRLNSSVRRP